MTNLKMKPAVTTSPHFIEASVVSSAPSAVTALEALELQNRLRIRSQICRYLIKALGCSTAACFGLIILQGFHAWGFQMDDSLLRWLCGATIVKSGILLFVFTNEVWQKGIKIRR